MHAVRAQAMAAIAPLRERDSLVVRIERIWNMRPSVLTFEYGTTDPDTGLYVVEDWDHLNRKDAALELRRLRKAGAYFHKSTDGYYVEREQS